MDKILEVSEIKKTFPGVVALKSVSFDLYNGEIHCLVGENGAGKSTLIKILSGAIKPDTGKIIIFDRQYNHLDPHISRGLGIQAIYQESNLIEPLSVAENIFFGDEKVTKFGIMDYKLTYKEAQNILDQLNVRVNAKLLVTDLSVAEKQVVKIAKALAKNTKILIMDEPTASLNQNEITSLLKLIVEIKSRGIGVIYISHRLGEVFEIADRITILRDGEKINTHAIGNVNENELISEMVGREGEIFYSRESVCAGKYLMEVENYKLDKNRKAISFKVREGEILGIAGMIGSGRSELVKGICSLGRIEKGILKIEGNVVDIKSPRDAIDCGICLVPEDRQTEGLIFCRSIKENISLPALKNLKGIFISLTSEKVKVSGLVKKLNIKSSSIEQLVQNLSGGNQQKVVLAKWLLANSRIFIFDEPTKGIDVGAKQEIYKLMIEIVKSGKAIIMISSDMPELISMSDKIIVLRNREMSGIIEKTQIDEKNILKLAIGEKK